MSIPRLLKRINSLHTFLLSTHVNPDPDALASELAMAMYLKSLGKRLYVINDDNVPKRYAFMPGTSFIKRYRKDIRVEYDAAIIVDCGDLDRIGPVKSLLREDRDLINIDHHITNDFFGTYNVVIPRASSSAEIVYDILKHAKFALTKEAATLLYLGIMTDTGSFRYDNTSAYTHRIVSELLCFDLPVSAFYTRLYESVPLNDLKHFTELVTRFDPLFNGKVICLELSKSTIKKFSEQFDLRDKIFRYLRAVVGVEVIVILTEQDKDKTRVNLRSQRRVDVARLAALFGGGGHARASGCLIESGMQEARRKILAQIKKVI